MSAANHDDVNPFAPPAAGEEPDAAVRQSDTDLRNEYLGGILLAAGAAALAMVFAAVSARRPMSDLGEFTLLLSRLAGIVFAIISLMFVVITLRAACTRIWRHLLILLGRKQ